MIQRTKIDLLRALEVFQAVADTGSMTAAARDLKITQSAISQQLKLLEAEMRVTLMDRNTRPLRLTPAGRALRNHAAEMLLHADQARAEVRQLGDSPLPHLRVAMFATFASTLAPAIVQAVVRHDLPVKTISILRGMAAHHARELPRRDVDVAITSNPLSDVEGMERHELIHERFVMILPKDAIPRHATLPEVAAQLPMIRYSARTEAGRMIENHLRRQRLDIPHGHSFDAPEDLFAMISLRQGWAITAPTHVVHAITPDMPVEIRQLPRPELGRSIVLIARRGELGSLPLQLANLCRRALRQDHLPRVQALMPDLANHFTVVDEFPQIAAPAADVA
jgi:DNA-binding transcriptional LysR family regulator